MALTYIALQGLAVFLLWIDCPVPALIVAGVALSLGLLARAWRSARPIKAPRPYPL